MSEGDKGWEHETLLFALSMIALVMWPFMPGVIGSATAFIVSAVFLSVSLVIDEIRKAAAR